MIIKKIVQKPSFIPFKLEIEVQSIEEEKMLKKLMKLVDLNRNELNDIAIILGISYNELEKFLWIGYNELKDTKN